MRILIVEDDTRIADNVRDMLKQATYTADTAYDGQTGLTKANSENYDLIILDWMLPDIDGTKVCKILRKQGSATPILILTAKTQLEDVIEGLDAGADDYLTKPFQMQELLARVRALLRRQGPTNLEPQITVADLIVDTNTNSAQRAGKKIPLSPKEYALLEYLARHLGQTVSRADLYSHIWGTPEDKTNNTLDVHIRYLRQKINSKTSIPLIHTVKGKGYVLTAKN